MRVLTASVSNNLHIFGKDNKPTHSIVIVTLTLLSPLLAIKQKFQSLEVLLLLQSWQSCSWLYEGCKSLSEWGYSFYEKLKLKFSGDTAVFTWEEGEGRGTWNVMVNNNNVFQTCVINQHFTKKSRTINLLSKEDLL